MKLFALAFLMHFVMHLSLCQDLWSMLMDTMSHEFPLNNHENQQNCATSEYRDFFFYVCVLLQSEKEMTNWQILQQPQFN